MKRLLLNFATLTFLLIFLYSCTSTGPGIFRKRSPHEQYMLKLQNAGLENTAMGKGWIEQAEKSLATALSITIPYQETGYFAADKIQATALSFEARRGEKITISLQKKPQDNFLIYTDLWKKKDNNDLKLLAYADTTDTAFSYEIDDEGSYLLRLQPELLVSGEYTLTITSGPSLAFPVLGKGRNSIQSLWGVDRDAGARRHEGIDIFAAKLTPAIAAAPGIVSRVTENNLGGKVVFLRPQSKDYVLYYAHLDTQVVEDGKVVNIGDTVGLIGNTGNARATSPHLHFGIYTRGGAVDPLPFIDPLVKKPSPITAPTTVLNKSSRISSGKAMIYRDLSEKIGIKNKLPLNTIFRVDAATGNWYKVTLPDGNSGFIKSAMTKVLQTPVEKMTIDRPEALLDRPDSLAARKMILPAGETVNVMGIFNEYYYVATGYENGWLKKF